MQLVGKGKGECFIDIIKYMVPGRENVRKYMSK